MSQQENQQEFVIQRIYVKDLSFESPVAPQVFREEWNPEVTMDISSTHEQLADDVYNVVVTVTANVKKADKSIFLVETQQAGIFTIKGFEGEQLDHLLGSFCLSVLFPYAREVISDLSVRGGFPPLYLAPINFDAYYAEKKRQETAAKSSVVNIKDAANLN